MGFPIYWEGKILWRNGLLAFSTACCCDVCCTFTGDEFVTDLYGTFDDVGMVQAGASTLIDMNDGDCGKTSVGGITFTVPAVLTERLNQVESYSTTVTIRLIEPSNEGCRWLVTIPQDPLGRILLRHSGSFVATNSCSGLQTVQGPVSTPNGWGFGEFVVNDPDDSAFLDQCGIVQQGP
jgi:hypothetical protein